MLKTLIYCTLHSEIIPLINFLKFKQNNSVQNLPSGNKISLYENDKYLLLVSNSGKKDCIDSLEYIYKNFKIKKAINIGISSCSDNSIKIGTLFCTNRLLFGINFGSITTIDTPLETDENLETLLIDNESKYFEEVSKKNIDNIYTFKVVSDYYDNEILKDDFISNLINKSIPTIERYL